MSRFLFRLFIGLFLLVVPFTAFAHEFEGRKVIHMSENGFEPESLEIAQGESVFFENSDKIPRWPASNLHPTHGIYPEFDPQKPIQPGELWQFKFKRAGEFRFHDHLSPSLSGVIKVRGPQTNSKSSGVSLFESLKLQFLKLGYTIFPAKFEKEFSGSNMYQLSQNKDDEQIKKWLFLMGSEKVMAKLLQDTEGGTKYDCHQEAHVFGRAAFKLFKQKAFTFSDTSCHSGFPHGAMEEADS